MMLCVSGARDASTLVACGSTTGRGVGRIGCCAGSSGCRARAPGCCAGCSGCRAPAPGCRAGCSGCRGAALDGEGVTGRMFWTVACTSGAGGRAGARLTLPSPCVPGEPLSTSGGRIHPVPGASSEPPVFASICPETEGWGASRESGGFQAAESDAPDWSCACRGRRGSCVTATSRAARDKSEINPSYPVAVTGPQHGRTHLNVVQRCATVRTQSRFSTMRESVKCLSHFRCRCPRSMY